MAKVYIESLGCARNQVDSETMATHLRAAGNALVGDPASAEVIVVNTCSFIQSAADESVDTILALAAYKTNGHCRQLIVAGCLPERYREDSTEAMPEVDLFLGTAAYDQVVAAVKGEMTPRQCLLPDPDTIDASAPVLRKPSAPHAAYLKIAEGCDRSCTFCIIPRLRGSQKSRPMTTLVTEAQALIDDGVKEITLVAQETTAYGQDLDSGVDFALLLATLAQLDDRVWIRFLYGHPSTLTQTVMQTVARFENLCPYFDIPIQHASDAILRRMGRQYSAQDLINLFGTIRTTVPRAVLRTTVLVGFPGEGEDDFSRLLAFTEQMRFDHLGVFVYSDAEDLPSHQLSGHVDDEVAQGRLDQLMSRQRAVSEEVLDQYHGSALRVLVESRAEPGIFSARAVFQAPEVDGSVLIRSSQALVTGTFVDVKVVETLDYDLIAIPL